MPGESTMCDLTGLPSGKGRGVDHLRWTRVVVAELPSHTYVRTHMHDAVSRIAMFRRKRKPYALAMAERGYLDGSFLNNAIGPPSAVGLRGCSEPSLVRYVFVGARGGKRTKGRSSEQASLMRWDELPVSLTRAIGAGGSL